MTQDLFAERALTWDEDPKKIAMSNRFVAELLININLEKEWKILEIGAGTGLVGLQLLPMISYAIFEDTSESMLNILNRKLSKEDAEKTTVLLGEVNEYKQDDIDLVISCMALHHIDDTVALVKHLSSIVKSKGLVVISDIRTEDGSFHHFQPIPHKGFDTDVLTNIFINAGFLIKKHDTYNIITRERTPGVFTDYQQFILIAEKG